MRKTIVASIMALALLSSIALAANVNKDLAQVRLVTARYHDVEAAMEDGYMQMSPCVESPDGAMGVHYMNMARSMDGVINPLEPEGLLYIPQQDGLRLVGVEYFIPAFQAAQAPQLFGQTFDGPMPVHDPMMPVHYDLHVWAWQANPAGMFAHFNPNLAC